MSKFYLEHFFKQVSVKSMGVDQLANSKFDMRVANESFSELERIKDSSVILYQLFV